MAGRDGRTAGGPLANDKNELALMEIDDRPKTGRLDRQVVFYGRLNPHDALQWNCYALVEMLDGQLVLFIVPEDDEEVMVIDWEVHHFDTWAAEQDRCLNLVPGTFAKRVLRNEAQKQIKKLIREMVDGSGLFEKMDEEGEDE